MDTVMARVASQHIQCAVLAFGHFAQTRLQRLPEIFQGAMVVGQLLDQSVHLQAFCTGLGAAVYSRKQVFLFFAVVVEQSVIEEIQ